MPLLDKGVVAANGAHPGETAATVGVPPVSELPVTNLPTFENPSAHARRHARDPQPFFHSDAHIVIHEPQGPLGRAAQ